MWKREDGSWTGRRFHLGANKDVFDAEVFAIYQALKAFEAGHRFAILADSQAAIQRIRTDAAGPGQGQPLRFVHGWCPEATRSPSFGSCPLRDRWQRDGRPVRKGGGRWSAPAQRPGRAPVGGQPVAPLPGDHGEPLEGDFAVDLGTCQARTSGQTPSAGSRASASGATAERGSRGTTSSLSARPGPPRSGGYGSGWPVLQVEASQSASGAEAEEGGSHKACFRVSGGGASRVLADGSEGAQRGGGRERGSGARGGRPGAALGLCCSAICAGICTG